MKKESTVYPYYPLFLKISGRKCIVIGGGQVALRKVQVLLEHGAVVEVVSPALCPELEQLSGEGRVKVVRRPYQTGDLRGAFVAFAATSDNAVNHRIAEDSRKETVLLNVVDNARDSDFIVPSYVRRGDVTIAASTSGKSPALARKIRTILEQDFGKEYASLANLVNEVRTEMKHAGVEITGDRWQEALDVDVLIELLKMKENEKAKAFLLESLRKVTVKT